MSKFEAFCDVMKSDGGPVIAGVSAITLLVGGYYVTKRNYKAEVQKGDASASLSPASAEQAQVTAPENAEA